MANKPPNIPNLLPPKIDYNKIYTTIGKANAEVGDLRGLLVNIPNQLLLIDPLLTNEALASSRIEGTHASLEDVYKYDVVKNGIIGAEKGDDLREVKNYKLALKYAIEKIKKGQHPISENFIKEIHSILLDSLRGERRDRGNLRRDQVYVGIRGGGMGDVSYTPPPPLELPRLLSNWEKYINLNQDEDPLVLAAVSHYQFEAIHPFKDGNGRIGRILIPIILFQKGYLPYPFLYMSEVFDHFRDYYIDNLRKMDDESIWEEWIEFFLLSVQLQVSATKTKALEMLMLYEKEKQKVAEFKSKYALHLFDFIFSNPVVSFDTIRKYLQPKSNQTIYNLLNKFEKAGILKEVTQAERNKVYIFQDLLEIVKKSKFEEE